MKRLLVAFSVIIAATMVFTVFSGASAASPEVSTNSSTWQVVASPPKVVLNSINYLEDESGDYNLSNGNSVVSENGIITITNTSRNWSVCVYNIASQISLFQYKLVFNSNYTGQENTTNIMLESTNGYLYKITNSESQITGIYNISNINTTTSAIVLDEYPIFATARIVYQQEIDAPTPPPGGGLSGYYAENHTEEIFQGNQVEEIWLNFTLWFYYNSNNQPVFHNAWWNMTAEASFYITIDYTTAAWQDTGGFAWISDNYYYDYYYNIAKYNFSTPVGGDAYMWYYGVYNWNDTDRNPIGYNCWENDTFAYPGFPVAVTLETSVPVKSL